MVNGYRYSFDFDPSVMPYTRPPSQLFQQQGHHLSYDYFSSRSRITCCHSSYSYCLLLAAFFTQHTLLYSHWSYCCCCHCHCHTAILIANKTDILVDIETFFWHTSYSC